MDLIGEGGFVDYGDAGWRGEVKFGFYDGEVFLPVGEAEFGFEISWLADDQAHEVSFRIGFEQDFADFLIGVGGLALGYAAHNVVVRVGCAVFGIFSFGGVHEFDRVAEFCQIGLPG